MSAHTPDWQVVLPEAEVIAEGITPAEVGDLKIALYHQAGTLHASVDACPHRGAPLTRVGELCPGAIVCGWHAWKFDLNSGAHVSFDHVGLHMLPVRVVEGQVEVDIAAPAPQTSSRSPFG